MPESVQISSANSSKAGTSVTSVLTIVAELPIPGVKKVLGPVNAVLKLLQPSPVNAIMKELEKANASLSNMYNVTLAALESWDLEKTVDTLYAKLYTVMTELGKDARLGGPVPLGSTKSSFALSAMVEGAYGSILEGERLLSRFEQTTKNDSGFLISYVGQYIGCFLPTYQCVALAQYAFNMIEDHMAQLEDAGHTLTDADKELRYEAARHSDMLMTATAAFFEGAVPDNYPSTYRPIFENKPIMLITEKDDLPKLRGHHMLVGDSNISKEELAEGIKTAFLVTLRDLEEEFPDSMLNGMIFDLVDKPDGMGNAGTCWTMTATSRDGNRLKIFSLERKNKDDTKQSTYLYTMCSNKDRLDKNFKNYVFGVDYEPGGLLLIKPLPRRQSTVYLTGEEMFAQARAKDRIKNEAYRWRTRY